MSCKILSNSVNYILGTMVSRSSELILDTAPQKDSKLISEENDSNKTTSGDGITNTAQRQEAKRGF